MGQRHVGADVDGVLLAIHGHQVLFDGGALVERFQRVDDHAVLDVRALLDHDRLAFVAADAGERRHEDLLPDGHRTDDRSESVDVRAWLDLRGVNGGVELGDHVGANQSGCRHCLAGNSRICREFLVVDQEPGEQHNSSEERAVDHLLMGPCGDRRDLGKFGNVEGEVQAEPALGFSLEDHALVGVPKGSAALGGVRFCLHCGFCHAGTPPKVLEQRIGRFVRGS